MRAYVFVLIVLIAFGAVGGLVFLSHRSGPPVSSPGPYGTGGYPGVSPLPAGVVGSVPEIRVNYGNGVFSGEQGPYCWAGNAATNQVTTAAGGRCVSSAPPTNSTGLPTIAVYPNARFSFGFTYQQHPESVEASIFQSGSMEVVMTNSSAINGFSLGSLPAGNYIMGVNASFGRSYTSEYYGIKPIESANYSEGSIAILNRGESDEMKSITQPAGNAGSVGGMTVSFPGLMIYHLTLSSANMVEDVNLSAISVITGDWVRFIPSYLPEVGPSGTDADMLVAGAFELSSPGNDANVSMIIQATTSGGSFGEVALPMQGQDSFVVLHTLATGQEFQGGGISATPGQTNFGTESIIYDPASGGSNQSLPVAVSIAGFFGVNGSVLPQPPWLKFSVPGSSTNLSMTPYDPLYFALDMTATSAAPLGSYTLVVDVEVGTGSLTLFIPVEVNPPVYSAAG